MTDPTITTRFAPSPTGALHVGGARTALFNWAYARRHGGRFLLRIEDTDRARSTEAAEVAILEDLRWLGLDWDNADTEPRQSQRLELYHAAVEKLLASGHAYEDGGAVRFRMPKTDTTFDDLVRGRVTYPAGQIDDFIIQKSDGFPTYHLAVVVDDAEMNVTHVLRGQEHLNNTPKHIAVQQALDLPRPVYGHFGLIFNPDGSKMSKRDKAKAARQAALRHLAGGIDRQQWIGMLSQRSEWSGNIVTPAEPPIPADRIDQFIDKKNDDIDIAEMIAFTLRCGLPEIDVKDFREAGYLPEALCNYLALLGWNPGNDVEKFDNAFLAAHFDFDRVNKADSKFDRDKLASFNAEMIRKMPRDEFERQLRIQMQTLRPLADWNTQRFRQVLDSDEKFTLFAHAYHERCKTLAEPFIAGRFFFIADTDIEIDPAARKKVLDRNDGAGWKMLRDLRDRLDKLPAGQGFGEAAHEVVKQISEEKQIGMGKVAQPLRVAVSGSTVTPPIDLTLEILGKQQTLARIDGCRVQQDHRPRPNQPATP